MITVKSPERYINQPDILKAAAEYIAPLGRKALVIGGKTALRIVAESLWPSLRSGEIQYKVIEFDGFVTLDAIKKFTALAEEFEADIIIGIGGGRVLDLSKAVGDRKQIPVAAVPTVAATCAAWSALTIFYDSAGKFEGGITLNSSPKLVLADTKILAGAPERFLVAGIGDTLAKWYEAVPSAHNNGHDISLKTGLATARLALDLLNANALEAIREARTGKTTALFREVVDSIILLAGLVGGVNGGNHRPAIGHAIYNSLTAFPESSTRLHGEKVAFGLLVQFILEGKPQEEIVGNIKFFAALGLPVTLSQLGIDSSQAEKISGIARGINIPQNSLEKLYFEVDIHSVEKALLETDRLGRSILDGLGRDSKIA